MGRRLRHALPDFITSTMRRRSATPKLSASFFREVAARNRVMPAPAFWRFRSGPDSHRPLAGVACAAHNPVTIAQMVRTQRGAADSAHGTGDATPTPRRRVPTCPLPMHAARTRSISRRPATSSGARSKRALTRQEERDVLLQHHGTGSALLRDVCSTTKEAGTYRRRLCGLPLFAAGEKFESGTGWPRLHGALYAKSHLTYVTDSSYGMARNEIRCARCGSHQGRCSPGRSGPNRTTLLHQFRCAEIQGWQPASPCPTGSDAARADSQKRRGPFSARLCS